MAVVAKIQVATFCTWTRLFSSILGLLVYSTTTFVFFENEIQFSYLAFALSPNARSTLSFSQCSSFLNPPDIASLFCDAGDNACPEKIKQASWPLLCNDYSNSVVLTQEEKNFICNTNQACLSILEVFDFDTFYSSYAREKRPQETYDPACQACSSLFENYDFADAWVQRFEMSELRRLLCFVQCLEQGV